jgi:hypothetical protein
VSDSEARTVTFTWSPEPKSEVEHQANLRKIARHQQALDELQVPVFGSAAPASKPKQRHYEPTTERLYARLCEVPRDIALEKAALRYDNAQRRFPVPPHLRGRGWPDTWYKAWQDKDGGFRKKLSDLRQSAWRWKLSK